MRSPETLWSVASGRYSCQLWLLPPMPWTHAQTGLNVGECAMTENRYALPPVNAHGANVAS